ncbi:MAG: uroporphyrinogen decarboxylase family protein [Firmicutes bacterium]|nr:uroporphyrinogen decarboxylase family protein [Bacillota bacterium]
MAWFDPAWEAEALGTKVERGPLGEVIRFKTLGSPAPAGSPDQWVSSFPIRHVLGVTERLQREVGSRTRVVGYLTGLRTLSTYVTGPDHTVERLEPLAQLACQIAQAYGEAGVRAVAVFEEEPLDEARWVHALEPVLNLCNYFGQEVFFFAFHPLPDLVRRVLRRHGARWMVHPGSNEPSLVVWQVDGLEKTDLAQRALDQNNMVVTSWDVPPDADPSVIRAVGRRLGKVLEP